MPVLTGRLAEDVVRSSTLVHRVCGESNVIPQYQFLNPDGTPLDLNPYNALSYDVELLVGDIDSTVTTTLPGLFGTLTEGLVRPDPVTVFPLLDPGTYQVRYSVTNGVVNFFSDTFYLTLTEHGPSPIENLGGYNP